MSRLTVYTEQIRPDVPEYHANIIYPSFLMRHYNESIRAYWYFMLALL